MCDCFSMGFGRAADVGWEFSIGDETVEVAAELGGSGLSGKRSDDGGGLAPTERIGSHGSGALSGRMNGSEGDIGRQMDWRLGTVGRTSGTGVTGWAVAAGVAAGETATAANGLCRGSPTPTGSDRTKTKSHGPRRDVHNTTTTAGSGAAKDEETT